MQCCAGLTRKHFDHILTVLAIPAPFWSALQRCISLGSSSIRQLRLSSDRAFNVATMILKVHQQPCLRNHGNSGGAAAVARQRVVARFLFSGLLQRRHDVAQFDSDPQAADECSKYEAMLRVGVSNSSSNSSSTAWQQWQPVSTLLRVVHTPCCAISLANASYLWQ